MRMFLMISLIILLLTGQAGATDTVDSFSRAEHLLETGKPDSAAVLMYDMLDNIEQSDRDSRVRTFYYLAMSMKQLGRLPDEINYLIMAREEGFDADFADRVRLAYAEILFETGNLDECIGIAREFRENFDSSPLLPDMLYIAGNAYLKNEDYLRASNSFSEIVRNHPDSEIADEAIIKEGVCLYNLNLISGAVERLELYLAKTPQGVNRADAFYYLGLSYEYLNQQLQAAHAYQRLVLEFSFHPEVMDVYFRLGKLYYQTNSFAEAENAFENYVYNADPADDKRNEALLFLERIKYQTGVYTSEADIAENFIAKYPENPKTPGLMFDLARYYKTMGKTEDAVEKYLILMNNPSYAAFADTAAVLIADTYTGAGQKEKAVVFLIRVAEDSTDPVRIQRMYLKLGSLHESWNQYDEAIGWYDRALAVNASRDMSFKSLWGIGRTFRKLNRWYEAVKTFERTIAEHPEHSDIVEIHLALAEAYFIQGRLKDSIAAAEKAVTLAKTPRKSDILLFLAEVYEEIDEQHALKLYSLIYNNTSNKSEQRTKALMQFGDLSLRMGDRRAAFNAFNRILSDSADSVAVNEARQKISRIPGIEDTVDSPQQRQ